MKIGLDLVVVFNQGGLVRLGKEETGLKNLSTRG